MTFVPLLVLLQICFLLLSYAGEWRSALVGAALIWSIVLLGISEALSAFGALAQGPLFCAWVGVAVVLVLPLRRRWPQIRPLVRGLSFVHKRLDAASVCLALALSVTLTIALIAPPNNVDSMTYHMGRVVEWLSRRSLEHFPTHVERQVAYSPFAEIVIANLQALSGGDRFANLVQWGALVLCAVTTSLLVQELGGGLRAQKLASVLVVTTPEVILQATSTQNDLVCSFFVAVAALHCLRIDATPWRNALALGVAAGLALATKGTAPVFILPFGVLALARLVVLRRLPRALAVAGLIVAVGLAINAPQWLRNIGTYGSPVGTRWLAAMVGNDKLGLGPTYSNLVRNIASHVGLPSAGARAPVLAAVKIAHRLVGLDLNDPRTKAGVEFSPAYASTHEDKAANTVQLLLLLLSVPFLVRRGTRDQRLFLLLTFLGFVLFGTVFKWQPWVTRLHTPFFVLATVPVALMLANFVPAKLDKVALALLMLLAAPWLVANSTRSLVPCSLLPQKLRGTDIWSKPRLEQYFANRPDEYHPFLELTGRLRATGCTRVGVLSSEDIFAYPLHIMLWDKGAKVTLQSEFVENPTAAYGRTTPKACALVSLVAGRPRGLEGTPYWDFFPAWRSGALTLYLPGASQNGGDK